MQYFEQRKLNFGFILFFTLFFASLVSQYKWASLVVIAVFSGILAHLFFQYFEDPERVRSNLAFAESWQRSLNARWAGSRLVVRNIEYYLREQPEGYIIGVIIVVACSLLICATVWLLA